MIGAGKKHALVIDLCEGSSCRDDLERNLAALKRNDYATYVASTEKPRRYADVYVPPTQSDLDGLVWKLRSIATANDEFAIYAEGKSDDGSLCSDAKCGYLEILGLNILNIEARQRTFVLPYCGNEGRPLLSASDAENGLSPRNPHDRLICSLWADWDWARRITDKDYYAREISRSRFRASERIQGEDKKDMARRLEYEENAYIKTAQFLSPRQAVQEARALQKLFNDDRWRVQRFAVRGLEVLLKRLSFDEAVGFLPSLRRLLKGDREVAIAASSAYIAVARMVWQLPPDIANRESIEIRQLLPVLDEEGRTRAINLYTWTINGLQGDAAKREAAAMRALFGDANPHIRNTVAKFYGWLDGKVDSAELHEGAKALRTILFQDEEPYVTLTAIETYDQLAPKFGDEELKTGATALRSLFEARESSVRKAAMRSYAKNCKRFSPEERSLGAVALAARVGDPDPYVAWAAADASLILQTHLQVTDVVIILTALRRRFADPDPYVRWLAVDTYRSLGRGQDDKNEMREGVVALRGCFGDPDPDVKSAALAGYRHIARSLAIADQKTEAGILREALAHERDPGERQLILGLYEVVTGDLQKFASREHYEEVEALEVLYCDGSNKVQDDVFSAYRTLLKSPHLSRDGLDALCRKRAYERDTPERRRDTKRLRLEFGARSALAFGSQRRWFESRQQEGTLTYQYREEDTTTFGFSLGGLAHLRRGVYLSDNENNMLTVGIIGAADATLRWKNGWAVLIPSAHLAVGWRWKREKRDEANPFYRSAEILLSGGPELRYVPFNNDEPSDLLSGWGGGLRVVPSGVPLGLGVQFSYFPQSINIHPEEGVERFFGDEVLVKMGVSVLFR